MNVSELFFPVLAADGSGTPVAHLGCAFPVNRRGDLLTCEHVVNPGDGNRLVVWHSARNRGYEVEARPSSWPGLDLAVILEAFDGEGVEAFFPFLEPPELRLGHDIYTFGYYSPRGLASIRKGYFGGKLVSIEEGSHAVKQTPYERLVLPYPVIEGLSGSPVLTYWSGVKAVGVCFGNEPQRITAYEVTEVEEGQTRYRETTHRIVEFGLAYPPGLIVDALADEAVEHTVSAGPVDGSVID
jgi:Trypsin-like peptidase domain